MIPHYHAFLSPLLLPLPFHQSHAKYPLPLLSYLLNRFESPLESSASFFSFLLAWALACLLCLDLSSEHIKYLWRTSRNDLLYSEVFHRVRGLTLALPWDISTWTCWMVAVTQQIQDQNVPYHYAPLLSASCSNFIGSTHASLASFLCLLSSYCQCSTSLSPMSGWSALSWYLHRPQYQLQMMVNDWLQWAMA